MGIMVALDAVEVQHIHGERRARNLHDSLTVPAQAGYHTDKRTSTYNGAVQEAHIVLIAVPGTAEEDAIAPSVLQFGPAPLWHVP